MQYRRTPISPEFLSIITLISRFPHHRERSESGNLPGRQLAMINNLKFELEIHFGIKLYADQVRTTKVICGVWNSFIVYYSGLYEYLI